MNSELVFQYTFFCFSSRTLVLSASYSFEPAQRLTARISRQDSTRILQLHERLSRKSRIPTRKFKVFQKVKCLVLMIRLQFIDEVPIKYIQAELTITL